MQTSFGNWCLTFAAINNTLHIRSHRFLEAFWESSIWRMKGTIFSCWHKFLSDMLKQWNSVATRVNSCWRLGAAVWEKLSRTKWFSIRGMSQQPGSLPVALWRLHSLKLELSGDHAKTKEFFVILQQAWYLENLSAVVMHGQVIWGDLESAELSPASLLLRLVCAALSFQFSVVCTPGWPKGSRKLRQQSLKGGLFTEHVEMCTSAHFLCSSAKICV